MKNVKEIADMLNINKQTIYRIIKKADIKGQTNPNKSNSFLYTDEDIEIIKAYVYSYRPNAQNKNHPDVNSIGSDTQNFQYDKIVLLEDKIKYLEEFIENQKLLITILLDRQENND